nr:hypothetical protein [Robertmurraya korlensis]
MFVTQLIKVFTKVNRKYVPTIALILGLVISIFISHRHHFISGVFMGWFYGYSAIGTYSSLKTTIKSIRNQSYQ